MSDKIDLKADMDAGAMEDMISQIAFENKFDENQRADFVKFVNDETVSSLKNLAKTLRDIGIYGLWDGADPKTKKSASFSYTNYREMYFRQMIITSMAGYMYRQLTEYRTPNTVPAVEVEAFMKDQTLLDPPPVITDAKMLKDYAKAKRRMIKEKIVIHKFLDRMFQFNPDRHVRSAYSGNKSDVKRRLPRTHAVMTALENRNTVRRVPVKPYEPETGDLNYVPRGVVEKLAYEKIPSADIFENYNRYYENHFEQYRQVVYDLYGNEGDVEYGMIVYKQHDNEDDANAFNDRYQDKVKADIMNIKLGYWALFGPYQKNRSRINYLNKHTEILKEMLSKRDEDSHLASDITRKRAHIAKAKNLKETGPDHLEALQMFKDNTLGQPLPGAEAYDKDVRDSQIKKQLADNEAKQLVDVERLNIMKREVLAVMNAASMSNVLSDTGKPLSSSETTNTSSSVNVVSSDLATSVGVQTTINVPQIASQDTSDSLDRKLDVVYDSSDTVKCKIPDKTQLVSSAADSDDEDNDIIIPPEEIKARNEARQKLMQMHESAPDLCPKDCVEINITKISEGGLTTKQGVIYNLVEAPQGSPAPK